MAKNQHGKLVCSLEAEKGEDHQYTCPGCESDVILKKGVQKMAHFAHRNRETCSQLSEGESEEHLKGKALIANYCDLFGMPYEVEAYLPDIQQRPDVLIKPNIAVEFQCSPLSLERLRERTKSYHTVGYHVIWVLGKKLVSSKGLTALQKQCLSLSNLYGFHYWHLDVQKERLELCYHLIQRALLAAPCRGYRRWEANDGQIKELLEGKQVVVSRMYQQDAYVSNQCMGEQLLKKLQQQAKNLLPIQTYLYSRGPHLGELPWYILYPGFIQPVLGEWEYVVRLLTWQYLKRKPHVHYRHVVEDVSQKLPQELRETITLLSFEDWVSYTVGIFLRGLERLGLLVKKDKQYSLSPIECERHGMREKFLKNRVECLSVPLKYDMIIR